MRKLTLTLVFTVLFSSTSFADWTEVSIGMNGNAYYVDFERIKKHDGYVYYWSLTDFLAPIEGYKSSQSYQQLDCNLFRVMVLQLLSHTEYMGRGKTKVHNLPVQDWRYPPPNSHFERTVQAVCEHVN